MVGTGRSVTRLPSLHHNHSTFHTPHHITRHTTPDITQLKSIYTTDTTHPITPLHTSYHTSLSSPPPLLALCPLNRFSCAAWTTRRLSDGSSVTASSTPRGASAWRAFTCVPCCLSLPPPSHTPHDRYFPVTAKSWRGYVLHLVYGLLCMT